MEKLVLLAALAAGTPDRPGGLSDNGKTIAAAGIVLAVIYLVWRDRRGQGGA